MVFFGNEGRKTLAGKVRSLRLERSWSQAQLAEAARLSIRTVQRVEKTGSCSHESLLALAAVFGLDITELTSLGINKGEPSTFAWMQHLLNAPNQFIAKLAAGYLVILILGVGSIALLFLQFYQLPEAPRIYSVLADHGHYHRVLITVGTVLATVLGLLSGLVAHVRRSFFPALLTLSIGAAVSAIAFAGLPWVIFRYDQYSPGFLWLLGEGPVVLAACAFCFILLRLVPAGSRS